MTAVMALTRRETRMSVVWKFALEPFTDHTIEMPLDAEVLTAAFQGETLQLWAECEPDAPLVSRRFHVVPTGLADVPQDSSYISTVFLDGLVFHVYEGAVLYRRDTQ